MTLACSYPTNIDVVHKISEFTKRLNLECYTRVYSILGESVQTRQEMFG